MFASGFILLTSFDTYWQTELAVNLKKNFSLFMIFAGECHTHG
jgi:hypothetical protein